MIRKSLFDDFIKGSTNVLYHIVIVGLSAALALSLPMAVRFIAREFLLYWSRIGNDKIFFLSMEIFLTVSFIFLSAAIRRAWKDRKLSNMARAAGMVCVTPAKGFFAKRRMKKLKESQGITREVMVISSTGFRAMTDPRGELHQVIQTCREAKIMLLDPDSEGAVVRAKGIPDPAVTPERFGDQIRKTIDFLKLLKAAQKNVRLKLYHEPPFLKMAILGDYVWLQHYQPGADVRKMPRYVFKHDPNIGSLYSPFYQYFCKRWNSPDIPEYDLVTDELIYRDMAGNEARREKMNGIRTARARGLEAIKPVILQNVGEGEQNETFSPLRTHQSRLFSWDFPCPGRQNFLGGLHPGGKEFSFLKSKNPICESAGWIAII